jgi:hypothetical protein
MDKGGTDGQGKLRQSWVWGSAATVHRPGETPSPQAPEKMRGLVVRWTPSNGDRGATELARTARRSDLGSYQQKRNAGMQSCKLKLLHARARS